MKCDHNEMLFRVCYKEFGYMCDTMQACRSDSEGIVSYNTVLQTALRNISKDSSISENAGELDAMLVIGDRAHDGDFATVLCKAPDDHFSNDMSVIPGSMQDVSPDSRIAGSRVMAILELRYKEWKWQLPEEGGESEHDEL
jgi:hypothetical protein